MTATLLCVALLAPGYGEKEILQRITQVGGGRGGASCIAMPRTTTDADLDELCELRHLERLGLIGTRITDKGLATVSRLRSLKCLVLSRTVITDNGLHHLETLKGLGTLVLIDCPNLTDEGVARLQKALPNCLIDR
jgi:hypothetical protein